MTGKEDVSTPTSAPAPVVNPLDAEANFDERERSIARLESAWGKCAHAFRTGHRFSHGSGILSFSLIAVHEELERRRDRLGRGDTMEILHAVELCALENVPLPTWLASAYRAAFGAFLKPGGPTSLDQAFTSTTLPVSTAKKAAVARQDWALGVQLYAAVKKIAPNHTAINGALDEVLRAKAWGVKKTKARRLVEMVERTHCELTGMQTLSQFWSNRRKGVHPR